MSGKEKLKKAIAVMLGVTFFLVVAASIIVANGCVLSLLWQWFFVPLGMPTITVIQAIGIILTIRFAIWRFDSRSDDEEIDPAVKIFTAGILQPCAVLLIGFIIHLGT